MQNSGKPRISHRCPLDIPTSSHASLSILQRRNRGLQTALNLRLAVFFFFFYFLPSSCTFSTRFFPSSRKRLRARYKCRNVSSVECWKFLYKVAFQILVFSRPQRESLSMNCCAEVYRKGRKGVARWFMADFQKWGILKEKVRQRWDESSGKRKFSGTFIQNLHWVTKIDFSFSCLSSYTFIRLVLFWTTFFYRSLITYVVLYRSGSKYQVLYFKYTLWQIKYSYENTFR